ncbi:L-fuculokinase [Neobacillus niacini]|uniref:FGGY-family carbohydrate kinase n=1 Tax=Neobacillus niacini TaxID=86668 RepID=UPI001C8E31A6|nr:FGGY family carbohydrate kinase [Neobacillus niacini]MBY0145951.1 carbohydrate kinase [Neobacillus niacini]
MALLGIDIGTTHCKAGVFRDDGSQIQIDVSPTITHYNKQGEPYYLPDEIWGNITRCLKEVMLCCDEKVWAIGITSMAETGLLVDRQSGKPRTNFIPWFSRCAEGEAEEIANEDSPLHRFQKTGLHSSYKYGLAKIIHLRKQQTDILDDAVWLSASDFIAYKLTGHFATDYSLAARTYAFQIDQLSWDQDWIRHFNLPDQLFPEALPSGTKMGITLSTELEELGIPQGIPVTVAGHDHLAAALAVGAVTPGSVFDSIGTAETLVGAIEKKQLTEVDFASGLTFGCHVVRDKFFWMGGISASGGSIEWFRNQFSDRKMSYDEIMSLSARSIEGPSGILYYPYLSGSGSPQPDPFARAAFIGLKTSHKREDLLKAMMEGTAYELESIRRSAEKIAGQLINQMISVGGGTKNHYWMQIKSDITNCHLAVPEINEATLLGAAITAGICSGVYKDEEEAAKAIQFTNPKEIIPNQQYHHEYKRLYEEGYMGLQLHLRNFYQNFHKSV